MRYNGGIMKVDDFIDFLEKYRGMDFEIVRSRNPEEKYLLETNQENLKFFHDNKVIASLETDDEILGVFEKNKVLRLVLSGY